MFYSTEILTSRKYGVATVWLVATLGSKSTLKKVTRKAILDVDVEKACHTIVAPEAPMALRLQSNLLYGMARVYAQQCNYILTDAVAARNQIRMMFKTMTNVGLDNEGCHKGRNDQLVVSDDPQFFPDFDIMPIDLSVIDFDATTAAQDSQRSILSPHSSQISMVSDQYLSNESMIPPSADSFVGGAIGRGIRGLSIRGDSGPGSKAQRHSFLEDDLGMFIDEDGTMLLHDEPVQQSRQTAPGSASSRVRRDHEGIHLRDEVIGQQDDGFMPIYDDDLPLVPDTKAFMPRDHTQTDPIEDRITHETMSESAEAPFRRRRPVAKKVLPVDVTTELRNGDLAQWNSDYLANMKEASRQSENRKAAIQAKKNAEHWVFGGLLREYCAENGPLGNFSGHNLLKNIDATKRGEKRKLEMVEDDDAALRVRPRGEETANELLRSIRDADYMAPDFDNTIEQGREAPTPLDERHLSSAFPWNQSTDSHRPAVFHSAGGAFQTSGSIAGGGAAFGSFGRRGSRLISASPLHGRGVGGDGIDLDNDTNLLLGSLANLDHLTGDDAFEIFGPVANAAIQTPTESQWQRAVLDGESVNFLEFMRTGIDQLEHTSVDDGEDETTHRSIDFDVLLPPESNSCVVAAQALLHVLTLGTKNLIEVTQEEAYGAISMRIVAVQ